MATGKVTGLGARLAKVFGKKGFGSEVKKIQKAEAEQRAAAPRILDTSVIADRDIDAAKLLMTTLGGQIRPITLADLEAFAANARKLGKKFKGGITAKGVIDASLQIDRDRANEQIRTAVAVSAQAGRLHFVTNAGPDSDKVRHHVHVEFPAFKAFSASPQDPKKLAKAMLEGPLRFDCDCGRHRYWYRYLATKGGFAAGRPETGFPKIRNPRLVGVACKHVLRVMPAILKDANVRAQAAKMIAAAQSNDTRAHTVTAAEAKAQAEKQIRESHHLKNRAETQAQALKRRSATTAGKARALAAAVAAAQRKMAAEVKASRKSVADAFAKLKTAPLTKAMRDKLIAQLMATQTVD